LEIAAAFPAAPLGADDVASRHFHTGAALLFFLLIAVGVVMCGLGDIVSAPGLDAVVREISSGCHAVSI
jgi:hypothetical protein